MANGESDDHPLTDTVLYGFHPFPPDIEELLRQVHARNPGVFNDLGWAPFEWGKCSHLVQARVLLKGLVEHHGHPEKCRRLVRAYEAVTGAGDLNV